MLLENGWGRIINIASTTGQLVITFGQATYAAVKAGVICFSKALAVELARSYITVNAVAIGAMATEMWDTVPDVTALFWNRECSRAHLKRDHLRRRRRGSEMHFDHTEHGGNGHRKERPNDAEERSANEDRDDDHNRRERYVRLHDPWEDEGSIDLLDHGEQDCDSERALPAVVTQSKED